MQTTNDQTTIVARNTQPVSAFRLSLQKLIASKKGKALIVLGNSK